MINQQMSGISILVVLIRVLSIRVIQPDTDDYEIETRLRKSIYRSLRVGTKVLIDWTMHQ